MKSPINDIHENIISPQARNVPAFLLIAGEVELEAVLRNAAPGKDWFEDWTYYQFPNLWMIHTGIGAMNAACAAYSFLKYFSPPACLHLGFSGAHRMDLKIGEIVLGQKICDFSRHTKTPEGNLTPRSLLIQKRDKTQQMPDFPADAGLYQIVKKCLHDLEYEFREGILGGADQFNRDSGFIQKVHDVFGTCCEDMESAAIAHVCARLQVPSVGIRVISNNELATSGKTEDGQRFEQKAFETLGKLGQDLIRFFEHSWDQGLHQNPSPL